MKRIIFVLFLLMTAVSGLYAGETHDVQQETSYEYYKYLTTPKEEKKDDEKKDGDDDDDDPHIGPSADEIKNAELEESAKEAEAELSGEEKNDGKVPVSEDTSEEVNDAENAGENAQTKKNKALAEAAEEAEDNQNTLNDKKNSQDSAEGGDPVKLTVGEYEQNETDILAGNTIAAAFQRKYTSNDKIVSSLGYGWTINLDQRIIYGTRARAEESEKSLEEYVASLKKTTAKLESVITKSYRVSGIQNAQKEMKQRVTRCRENLERVKKLYNSVVSLEKEAKGYKCEGRIRTLKERTGKLKNSVSQKLNRLQDDQEKLEKDLAVLEGLKDNLKAAEGELAVYRKILEETVKRRKQNTLVMFRGMEKFYEETGDDTITLIDEKGYPHILYETESGSGVWKNAEEKRYMECRKEGENLVLYERDGSVRQFDKTGFIISITDRNQNQIRINRGPEGKILCVESSDSEKLLFTYEKGLISRIENARDKSQCVSYSHEENRLTGVKDTDGDVVTMDYDSNGRMISLNKCDGSSVRFTYGETDSEGHVLTTATTSEEGCTEQFIYDRSSRKTEYIDHDGNLTRYWYDEKHRTVREERADKTVIINAYDEDGNLTSESENGHVTHYEYDKSGNLLRAGYEDGTYESFQYDSFNLVVLHKDRDGVYEEFIRDEKGNLAEYKKGGKTVFVQKTDGRGLVTEREVYSQHKIKTQYEYDIWGNLVKETTGDVTKTYEYDSQNRLIKLSSGGKVLHEYSYQDHTTIKKSYNGLETKYVTNGRKDLTQIIQKDSVSGIVHKTRIEYDRRHLPLRVYRGDGEKEELVNSYLYTAEGKVCAQVQHGKESWIKVYEYKGGRISEEKQFMSGFEGDLNKENRNLEVLNTLQKESGDKVLVRKYDYSIQNRNRKKISITDGEGNKSLFEYDAYGNLVRQSDGEGCEVSFEYSGEGKLLRGQSAYGGCYAFEYGADGLLKASGEEGAEKIQSQYYPDGSVKSKTDRYGRVTVYGYDRWGRLTLVQSEARKTWYEYDLFDRVTKEAVGNAIDCVWYREYEYSEDGRKVSVTEGGKYKKLYELDAFGNVLCETDGKGNTRVYEYDAQNRMTMSLDGYQNKTLYEYNALGKPRCVTLPGGEKTEYYYNHLGLVEKICDGCGVVYTASYDKAGRLEKERNRADTEKTYEYDKAGRVTKVLCGGEVIEAYTYGANGRTVTVRDGKGNDYVYSYDSFGRLSAEKNRAGLEQKYYYDKDGRLNSQSDFAGGTVTVTYSSDQTVRTVNYADGSENRFVYDAMGNITEASNAYGKTTYRYDQGGRLVLQKEVTTGEEIRFEYDAAGNRTRLYGSNRETGYVYGRNNEVKEIFDNKQRLRVQLEYDKNGREVLRRFGNGTKEETLYDRAGRVAVKTQKTLRGELLWGEGYVYGQDGKRTATVDNCGRVTLYEYNKKGQLETVYYPYTKELMTKLSEEAETNGLAVTGSGGENRFLTASEKESLVPLMNAMQYGLYVNLTALQVFVRESYVYDANGNRTAKTTPYGTIEYNYDNENRLTSSGSRGQTFVSCTWDRSGNLLTEESAQRSVKYAYNAQNRLIYCEVTDKAKKEYVQTSYAYDAFGRRVIVKDKGEAALRTIYDGFSFDVIKSGPVFENGMFTDSYDTGIKYGKTGRPTGERYRYLDDTDA
ncbi:MAG: hypothetical protein J5647_13140, partial [Spirochaetaceae bacterium]|nr:hypothetical protein [Spirochaetaceae bacterium]